MREKSRVSGFSVVFAEKRVQTQRKACFSVSYLDSAQFKTIARFQGLLLP